MKQADYYKKFLYIKMSETIYYQRNKETISNRAKDYYKAYIFLLPSDFPNIFL